MVIISLRARRHGLFRCFLPSEAIIFFSKVSEIYLQKSSILQYICNTCKSLCCIIIPPIIILCCYTKLWGISFICKFLMSNSRYLVEPENHPKIVENERKKVYLPFLGFQIEKNQSDIFHVSLIAVNH